MIYIDPPYNTGRDFIYKDKRIADADEYLADSEQIDEDGNYLVANPASNGRFHSDWLSFIYPRLKLARNLLRDDGVIFISIDDNEQANLKKLCDEIFGAENFQGDIHWRRRHNQPNDKGKMIAKVSENILVYSREATFLKQSGENFTLPLSDKRQSEYKNPDNDPRGAWTTTPWKTATNQGGSEYTITTPTGRQYREVWMGNAATFQELLEKKVIIFTNNGDGLPRKKIFLADRVKEGRSANNFWNHDEFGSNQEASQEVAELVGKGVFDYPKPVRLLDSLINIAGIKADSENVQINEAIILDFFAGSGTMAQAVMGLNAKDGGRRKFILVQLPEAIDENEGEQKAAYDFCLANGLTPNIAEICKERIRRAGQMIKAGRYADGRPVKDWQKPKNLDLDIGFRVFKIGSSNMREDYYRLPQETDQAALTEKVDNVKKNRTDEDLLFQLFLEWGVPLSARIEKEEIDGRQVFFVNKAEFEGIQTDMIACFDRNLAESLLIKLAQLKPLRAVFRDHGFANDSIRENLEGIFKQIAPKTELKVI